METKILTLAWPVPKKPRSNEIQPQLHHATVFMQLSYIELFTL